MPFNSIPITDLIQRRYSCRSYDGAPVAPEAQARLVQYLRTESVGPFGTAVRAELVAAAAGSRADLKGLGTYGLIRGAPGFIVGAADSAAPMALEDFGFAIERAVLYATALDLGTCWVGGLFTRSRFAAAIGLGDAEGIGSEILPAVVVVGHPALRPGGLDRLFRRASKGDQRLPWDSLFFDGAYGVPLARESAGAYAAVLDMVRWAPSASNKQPWRIVREGERWHLYIQRIPRYAARNASVGVADMQSIDMGIAMCHFQLSAEELGLTGHWANEVSPAMEGTNDWTSYVVTWEP